MENLTTEQPKSIFMDEWDKPGILYIDDEEDNLIVFKAAFRRFYKVYTAISGEEGLEIMRSEEITLVITDQRMPRMTGIEFLQNLPEDGEVIRMILTGYSDVEAVIDAINTGKVYRYITKPWSKDELKITLDNAIEAFKLRKMNKKLITELKEANEYLEQKVLERTIEVSKQKLEIENLLLNILPVETAQELKEKGYATPHYYDSVSVLFTDFKDFSKIAESLSPQELVAELNACFMAFDEIVEKYNLEKIKTIGDAYMCAGGIPVTNHTHPLDVIRAGMAIQAYMQIQNEKRIERGALPWLLRIGIHTGPVVAGVVGRKKFAYDIWGDAVNIASRMETSGEAGQVNISAATFDFVKDEFVCFHRGKIRAKNKGEIDMYFVERGVMSQSKAVL